MKFYVCLGLFLVAVASGLCAPCASGQTPLQLAPQEGVLLLANGQVLTGKITRAGEHYFVALPQGEIRLKLGEVEMFCRDLDEGYRRKREAVVPGQVNDHLELANWCIQQGLYGYAARELSEALQAEPQHPKIPVLERRLQLAMQSAESEPPKGPATPLPSNDDLDRLVRGLPAGSVEAFAQTIQPLLLNSCTTSGCHGPGSTTGFSLHRVPLSNKTPSRRLTQRNLMTVLRYVDSTNPAESPLLALPIKEHGPARAAIFMSRDMAQYRQLTAWVGQVTRGASPPVAQSVTKPAQPLLQSVSGSAPPAAARPAAASSPAATASGATGRSSTSGDYTPVDPFDAEVFNRQYFPPE